MKEICNFVQGFVQSFPRQAMHIFTIPSYVAYTRRIIDSSDEELRREGLDFNKRIGHNAYSKGYTTGTILGGSTSLATTIALTVGSVNNSDFALRAAAVLLLTNSASFIYESYKRRR